MNALLPTGALYGRACAVTIASPDQTGVDLNAQRYTGLRVKFQCERSLRPEPNKCEVTLTNLSAATRAQIKVVRSKGIVTTPMAVIVDAGYGNSLQTVFQGDVRNVEHKLEGTDWNSHFSCSDGGNSWSNARTSRSFSPGTSIAIVITALASDLGIGTGNLTQALATPPSGGVTVYQNGFSCSGLASRELSRVLTAAGYEWSIQDGALQILQPGSPATTTAYLLNSDTGLIGTPELGEQNPQTGSFLKVKTLLLPSLRPGSLIQLDAVATKGLFRIQKCVHTGDSMGSDWYSEMEVTRT